MRRILLLLLSLVLSILAVSAQPDPDRAQPEQPFAAAARNQPQPREMLMPSQSDERDAVVEVTPAGVFLLYHGVLARFDPQLAQPTVSLALFGPMPEQPQLQPNMDRDAMVIWQRERMKRMMPGAMIVDGEALLIVCGDTFFRVQQRTLVVETKRDLAPRNERDLRANRAAPLLKLNGDTLYLMRTNELLALQAKTGEAIGQVPLPKEMVLPGMQMQPQNPPPNTPFQANPDGRNRGFGQPQTDAQPFQPGGQPQPGRQQPGAQQQPAGQVQTIVGKLVQYKNINNGIWTLKDDGNVEYVLEGDTLDKLLKTDNLTQQRVRVTGMLSSRREQPDFCRGYLHIDTFEVLAP